MAKYDALRDFLTHRGSSVLTLSFDEISRVVPGGLPASAYAHPAWWSNDSGGTHAQSRAWIEAGYLSEAVNVTTRRVTFRRTGPT